MKAPLPLQVTITYSEEKPEFFGRVDVLNYLLLRREFSAFKLDICLFAKSETKLFVNKGVLGNRVEKSLMNHLRNELGGKIELNTVRVGTQPLETGKNITII